MTHLSVQAAALAAACCATLACAANGVHAQCATCPTPTVSYAPAVAAPTAYVVTPRPGLFDRLRMRRWGVTAPVVAPAYAVGYAPTYAAAYAPSYAPAYTAGYAPYMTAYAPLQPTTVYRPVALSPVAPSTGCATCAYAPSPTTCCYPQPACDACVTCHLPCESCSCGSPCAGCSSCGTSAGVEQAGFAAPSADCPSCGGGSVEPYYGTPAASGDPQTPTPELPTDFGTPIGTGYPPESAGEGAEGFSAPPLMAPPFNGQTASRPTVGVHTAVYRRPVEVTSVNATTAPVPARRAVDAGGWSTAPATR